MTRFFNTLVASILALISGASVAPAATLLADPNNAETFFSSFHLFFQDLNGNGLVEFGEIEGFGGLRQTMFPYYPAEQSFLLAIPQIDGISVAGNAPGVTPKPDLWIFSAVGLTDPQLQAASEYWQYTILAADVAPIPLPASALLLAAGLTGLAAVRRKSRQA